MDDMKQFGEAYWKAKHPEVRALRGILPAKGRDLDSIDILPDRQAAAIKLWQQGHTIDAQIDILFADIPEAPYLLMAERRAWGYTWYPALGMPTPAIAPGLASGGAASYDPSNPPKGSIKVSLNLADYPPFDPPVPAVPAPAVEYVPVGGPLIPGLNTGKYHSSVMDRETVGTTWKGFVKRGVVNPFGMSVWWEKVS
jgi:hypothetical protein